MGIDVLETFPLAKKKVEQAQDILKLDFLKLVSDSDKLNKTKHAQLAIYILSCALYEILAIKEMDIAFVAGHSLGEFSAIYASGSITFEYGLEMVKRRAELMGAAAKKNPGAMAAVMGMSTGQVKEIAGSIDDLYIANINSGSQIVLSGSTKAVENSEAIFLKNGAKRFIKLSVGGAFHSKFMADAAQEFKKSIDESRVADPKIPVISNITAEPMTSKKEIIYELANQMCSNVNWLGCVTMASKANVDTFVEVGPGAVLSNLIKRIDSDLKLYNMSTVEKIEQLPKEWINE
jgi:[acyl-carrier-protein] S-malonyltransferase